MDDGWVNASCWVRGDRVRVNGATGGAQDGYLEVGGAVCHDAHCDEYNQQVHVDGCVGQPPIFLESAHLTEEEATDRPDETTNCVAEAKLGHLGEGLAVGDDNESHATEELHALE